MITSWKDMPIRVLEQINDIDGLHCSDDEKTFKATALLAGMDYDDFLNLPLDDARELVAKTSFVQEQPRKVRTRSEYRIGRRTYCLFRNIMQLTTSQYIDYQALLGQDISLHLPELMAIVLVPKGHKYGDGYDTEAVIEEIRNNMGVEDALSVADFFTRRCYKSMRRMIRRSEAAMWIAKMRAPKDEREAMEAMQTALRLVDSELLSEFGCHWWKRWPK